MILFECISELFRLHVNYAMIRPFLTLKKYTVHLHVRIVSFKLLKNMDFFQRQFY